MSSTPGSSPPAQPPMMSPDGKWVWDGQKWIPVAVHESVFPAYTDAAAAAASTQTAAPLAETMISPPVNPFATPGTPSPFATPPQGTPFGGPPAAYSFPPPAQSAPAVVSPPIVQPPSYSAGGATPPWQAWAAGGGDRSRMMKLGAAFVAAALGVIVLIYFGLSELPFLRASNDNTPSPTPVASPTPQLAARSDFAVADRYVNTVYKPAMARLDTPLTDYFAACNGTLSASCQQGSIGIDQATTSSIADLKAQNAPVCIGPQVAKVLADLVAMEAGLKAGLKGFADNNRTEMQHGLGSFNTNYRVWVVDAQRVAKAQATCDTQPAGP